MKFKTFAEYLQRLEETNSRNEMVKVLAKMFGQATPQEAKLMAYLSLGRLGPKYACPEFGIATKSVLKILARTFNKDPREVEQLYKKKGDLGEVVWEYSAGNSRKVGISTDLSVEAVFDKLLEVTQEEGVGSQERRFDRVSRLLNQLDPVSAKYVVRILVGRLRLGFSDMTILDALSYLERGDKSERKRIEQAYNVSADIGRIACEIRKSGVASLGSIGIEPGVPIRMAAAERLPTARAIIEKLGVVAAEPKIDGFRLQCHYVAQSSEGLPSKVRLFSRNLENMTAMFPEIVKAVQKLRVDSIIFEGEAVAYNPVTEEFLPFQETMQRRRKYGIEEKAKELPLKLFAFDLLYLNGKSYLAQPYRKRRLKLFEVISPWVDTLDIVEEKIYRSARELQGFFLEQIEHGLEGIMAKRLDAPYTAGSRNFNWVKLKREKKGRLEDTIDCVVMGYKLGTGKRARFGIGAFLVGVYDAQRDLFETVSNVGTGLTDEQWRRMKARADRLRVSKKPVRYVVPKELQQDVWVAPGMVVEVLADEITRSPVHTAGKEKDGYGYALRFPRLVRWREDKTPEQATTVEELKLMFRQQ